MTSKAWSGRFEQPTDKRVERFTESISFDYRLGVHDIQGSIAHVEMLSEVGLISFQERTQLCAELRNIDRNIREGQMELRPELEDIHMHIERDVIDALGDIGRKIHTGRSRNDQVSTAFRLWMRDSIAALDQLLGDLQLAFVNRAESDMGIILPAYTHMQRAQPVLASHYWLAYCEKLQRDRDRLQDTRKRVNVLPLGTAALSGSSLPLDRESVASKLGFDAISQNSLDASSDRDFAAEFLFDLALIAEHLSSWAEEWIIWSTIEFDFIRLPDAFCTGSSIMPQKKNPDVLELIRGKTGRVLGDLQALLIILKGLPLAYNRDLQEDKIPVFDAYDTVGSCLSVAAPLVDGIQLNQKAISSRLEQGFLDATTLMEYLIGKGIPMRTGHEMVGQLVKQCEQHQMTLSDLPLEDFQKLSSEVEEDVFDHLGVQNAVKAFQTVGSTAFGQVQSQLSAWQGRLRVSPDPG